MAFKYQTFDVEIERQVGPNRLSWPNPGQAMDDGIAIGTLGGNLLYRDLRYLSWAVARTLKPL